jgi:hypothetical protein
MPDPTIPPGTATSDFHTALHSLLSGSSALTTAFPGGITDMAAAGGVAYPYARVVKVRRLGPQSMEDQAYRVLIRCYAVAPNPAVNGISTADDAAHAAATTLQEFLENTSSRAPITVGGWVETYRHPREEEDDSGSFIGNDGNLVCHVTFGYEFGLTYQG